MSVTDMVLIAMIALALAFALYDEFIIDKVLKGKTHLNIGLRRQNRIDGLIFIGLVLILVYQNVINKGTAITTILLLALVVITVFLAYIRQPKLIFKQQGFYYGPFFINYVQIENMNLSTDGYLVIDLARRRLLIQVRQMDDLEAVYNYLVENQ